MLSLSEALQWIMECDYAVMGVLDDYDPRHKKVWWRQVALTQPETQNHATVALPQWLYQFLPTPVTYGVPLPSIPSLGRPALVPTGDHGTIHKSASKLDTELRSFPQGRSPRAGRPGPLRVSGMMMLALEVSCFMWICGPFNGLWTDHCNWDGQPSDCDENINKCILSLASKSVLKVTA